jgi:hypothetical protein
MGLVGRADGGVMEGGSPLAQGGAALRGAAATRPVGEEEHDVSTARRSLLLSPLERSDPPLPPFPPSSRSDNAQHP